MKEWVWVSWHLHGISPQQWLSLSRQDRLDISDELERRIEEHNDAIDEHHDYDDD